jgi:hypothetical protein
MALQPLSVSTDTSAGYVDWCAIAAGAMLATAVSIILFTFGTAIGLSMVSPYEGEGVSRAAYLATLGLWTLWVIVSSFMAGGYLAGRLRRRVGDATEHEVDVRDGAHGLLVWATGVVVASLLLMLGVTGAVGTAAKAGAPAAAAASDDNGGGMTAFTVDALFRAPANGAAPQASVDPATGAMSSMPPRDDDAARDRDEVSRLLTYGLSDGRFGSDDKAHVARLISRRTGMSETEAQARIDTVLAKAKETADAARKIGVIVGFLTAAALLVGAAAGAWAAAVGGRHRDQNTDTAAFWRWI